MTTIKIQVSKVEKANQAITALEIAKKNAQNFGGMRQTLGQKNANVAEIQKKIDAWKKKIAVTA
jgi:hypothetical protein